MKRSYAFFLMIMVLGSCAQRVVAQTQAVVAVKTPKVDVSRTYTSPDGHFSFEYPLTWFIEEHWSPQESSFLTNFKLGVRCCDMEDGDLKMDFGPAKAASGETVQHLLRSSCTSNDTVTIRSCAIVQVNHRAWARVESDDMGFRDLYMATVSEGRTYSAAAFIPGGASLDAGVAAFDRIFRTLRLR